MDALKLEGKVKPKLEKTVADPDLDPSEERKRSPPCAQITKQVGSGEWSWHFLSSSNLVAAKYPQKTDPEFSTGGNLVVVLFSGSSLPFSNDGIKKGETTMMRDL